MNYKKLILFFALFLVFPIASAAVFNATLDTSLQVYYNLNELSGTTVIDSVANHNSDLFDGRE